MTTSKNLFEDALVAEGVTGRLAEVARSIYKQESGGGKNTKTSNAGAVGGMQIIPATFASVADKGWDINDPLMNARAGIRYVRQLDKQAGGDPALTAAGYYGGPGGLEKARKGIAVSDPRNPNAPTTLEYGRQVAGRLGKAPSYLDLPDNQFANARLAPTSVATATPVPEPIAAPVALATSQAPETAMMGQAVPAQIQAMGPTIAQGPDQWQEFIERSRQAQSQPVQVADLNYGGPAQIPQMQIPDFMSAVAQGQNRPNFQMLRALKGWA